MRFPTVTALCIAFLSVGCASVSRSNPAGDQVVNPKSDKDVSKLYSDMGTGALMRNEPTQAVEDFRNAIQKDPDNYVAHNHLGYAYYSLGDHKMARTEFEKAVKVKPDYSDAWVNLGNLFAEERQVEKARQSYRRALTNMEYKQRHRALTNLAELELSQNNVEQARTILYQSLQANPDYCLSHFLLGNILERDGNMTRAADELAKSVVKNCVANVEGHLQLGLAYEKLKRLDKARAEFRILVDQYPESTQAQRASEKLKDIP